MIRTLFVASAVAAALYAAAAAQEPADELDALSRSADDPFTDIIKRPQRMPVSVTLRALDKITARYTDIEASMNEIARFGSLEIVPRFCDKRPPEEFPETSAFLEVFDLKPSSHRVAPRVPQSEVETVPGGPIAAPMEPEEALDVDIVAPAPAVAAPPAGAVAEGPDTEGERIFTGWMFASSPALNALEHPVYDVWVIDCKTAAVDK